MLAELLRRPQATIPQLVADESSSWLPPLVGYFCVAFAEGYERIALRFPELSALALVGIVAVASLVLGVWAWALLYGGALYGAARLFRGRPGAADSIMAVGYALFWPGVVAALASAAVLFAGYRGRELSTLASFPAMVQIGAGFWAVYAVIAALRAHHRIGWWRAIGAYLLPIIAVALTVFVALMLFGWATHLGT